jgi:exodeoxyribonuclease VII small subunit
MPTLPPAAPPSDAGGTAPPERFDEILTRLRALVERLEGGNLPLEEGLRSFEEGMELCRRGAAILDSAEKKVETLIAGVQSGTGAPRTAPFEMPEE